MLKVSGDEDASTQAMRRQALSRALSLAEDLTVDMSELEYGDRTLMLDLAMVARRLRKAGAEMRIQGAQPHVEMLIQIAGLHNLPSVQMQPA